MTNPPSGERRHCTGLSPSYNYRPGLHRAIPLVSNLRVGTAVRRIGLNPLVKDMNLLEDG